MLLGKFSLLIMAKYFTKNPAIRSHWTFKCSSRLYKYAISFVHLERL